MSRAFTESDIAQRNTRNRSAWQPQTQTDPTPYVVPVKAAKPAKYRNVKTEVDGITFDSKKEAARWQELQLLQDAGHILFLQRQKRYKFEIHGQLICTYIADFIYREREGGGQMDTVEDVKSDFTRKNPVYRIKKKLMQAVYRIEIKEV